LHGAYGWRWRNHFAQTKRQLYESGETTPIDQLLVASAMLKHNPHDRRVIIQIWDCEIDLGSDSLDVPCNLILKPYIQDGVLDLQVYCRSNDAVWGCYGANAVQFSFLQEYLAAHIGVPMGSYYQISADFHAYQTTPYQWAKFWPLQSPHDDALYVDPYNPDEHSDAADVVIPLPLINDIPSFDIELNEYMMYMYEGSLGDIELYNFNNVFFERVAHPMWLAHYHIKRGSLTLAIKTLIGALSLLGENNDWLRAGLEWCERLQAPTPHYVTALDGSRDTHAKPKPAV
jgi:hypothetical protein